VATAGSESDGCYAAHSQALEVKYEHPIVLTDVEENDRKRVSKKLEEDHWCRH